MASPPSIKAFILHLGRARARQSHAEALALALPQLGCAGGAEILPAIDAQKLTEAEIKAVCRRKIFYPAYPFSLKPAEIACFLSHRAAWQALLDQGFNAAFITEDDMQPQAEFAQGMALAAAHIGACGLIRFPHRNRERGRILAQAGKVKLIRPSIIGLGAVAYLLSREAAAELLAFTRRFDRPLDVMLQMFWRSGVHSAALCPGGIAEISAQLGGSTLAEKRNLRQKLRHEILRPLYRGQINLLSRLKSA